MLHQLQRFVVRGRLGSGGMAEVFLAQDAQDPARHAVIKRMHPHLAAQPELVTMFLDEARLGMRLTHPNLCRFFDAAEVEGQPCIAMEFIDGVTLSTLMERAALFGGLPHAVPLSIAASVAGALDSVHRARSERGRPLGIVHRDVCPKNVMVGFDGRVKLLDFGIAKSLTNHSITEPGMAKGKLAYIAPEQWEGRAVDPRADVFALGVCLFEALSGRPLYHYARAHDAREAIVDGPVPSLRDIDPGTPAALDALVARCLAKDPADRYPSAGALEAAIQALLADLREQASRAELRALLASLFAAELLRGPELEPTGFGAAAAMAPPPALPERADLPSLPPSTVGDLPPHFMATAVYEAPTLAGGDRRWPALLTALGAVALVLGSAAAMVSFLGPDLSSTPVRRTFAAAPPEAPMADPPPLLEQALVGDELSGAPSIELEPVELEPETPGVRARPVAAVARPALDVSAPSPRLAAVVDRARAVASEAPAVSLDPTPADVPAPAADGLIDLNSQPWSEVFVDGERLGYTPIGRHRLPVGVHQVRLVDGEGRIEERSVEVSSDDTTRLFVRFDGAAPSPPLAGL